jgi:hypothetical protein
MPSKSRTSISQEYLVQSFDRSREFENLPVATEEPPMYIASQQPDVSEDAINPTASEVPNIQIDINDIEETDDESKIICSAGSRTSISSKNSIESFYGYIANFPGTEPAAVSLDSQQLSDVSSFDDELSEDPASVQRKQKKLDNKDVNDDVNAMICLVISLFAILVSLSMVAGYILWTELKPDIGKLLVMAFAMTEITFLNVTLMHWTVVYMLRSHRFVRTVNVT